MEGLFAEILRPRPGQGLRMAATDWSPKEKADQLRISETKEETYRAMEGAAVRPGDSMPTS